MNRDMTIFDLVDEVVNNAFNGFDDDAYFSTYIPAKVEKEICSSSFPPSNVDINQDTKVLTIECSLTGVKEDEFSLDFENDKIKLVVKKDNDMSKRYYLQHGLKLISNGEIIWKVDLRNYDRDSTKVTYENGLLRIVIQPNELSKPRTQKLFGKLKSEAIEESTSTTADKEKK